MSSIQKTASGYRIQFRIDGKRRQISLRHAKKRAAESVRVHLDELIACRRTGERVQDVTTQWVQQVAPELRNTLTTCGLISGQVEAERSIVDLWDDFISRRPIKASTARGYQQTREKLRLYFGARSPIAVTAADAEDWRDFMRTTLELGENTVRKRCSQAGTFWRWMIRRDIVTRDVFADLPKTVGSARDSKPFVPACDVRAIIDQITDVEWRLLVALARWGGLRTPSEPCAMRWEDIEWDRRTMRVTASKTDTSRIVPIFPEITPYLDAAWDAAEPGAVWVLPALRHHSANLHWPLTRWITQAGLTPWPRLFNSMRSTRETELAATYPLHVVCAWIGNSQAVALRHYLTPTDADIQRASADNAPPLIACKSVK